MNENSRTEIGSLGEFGLINHLTRNFELKNAFSVKGIGDDAAVIDNQGNMTVVSTDLLVEHIHFDMIYTPLKHLGYKSVVVNLSDIVAMNAKPRQVTVSIAVSNRFSVEALEELYDGIHKACEFYDVDLVGGDTTSSVKGLVISVTAIGEAPEDKLVYRDGAQPGDLVCVSGDLGAAYLGLQLLEREKRIYIENPGIQPELDKHTYLVGRHLKPEARTDVIRSLEELAIRPTAMIDVSDGISSEIRHICKASDTGVVIEEAALPIREESYNMALEFHIDPTTAALNGGEDYEILFTVSPSERHKMESLPLVTIIGEIKGKEEGLKLKSKSGNLHELPAQGWDHMKQ